MGLFTKNNACYNKHYDMYSEEKIKLVESCLNALGVLPKNN